jgi:hypothetical protein
MVSWNACLDAWNFAINCKIFRPQGLSVKQKEDALNFVLRSVPGFDSMDVQDALMKCKWDKHAAVEELQSRPPKPGKRAYSHTVTPTNRNGNKPKKARKESDDCCDSGNEAEYNKSHVFDSDDSENDGEYGGEMSIHRKEVYDFFNNANLGELSSIKTCSMKKVEVIIENRPYRNWEELVAKCEEKPLSTDLLNYCQEYLDKRNSLKKLMKKCKTIKAKLEKAVADGAGISEQPSNLNEGLKLSDYQLVSVSVAFLIFPRDCNCSLLLDRTQLARCNAPKRNKWNSRRRDGTGKNHSDNQLPRLAAGDIATATDSPHRRAELDAG